MLKTKQNNEAANFAKKKKKKLLARSLDTAFSVGNWGCDITFLKIPKNSNFTSEISYLNLVCCFDFCNFDVLMDYFWPVKLQYCYVDALICSNEHNLDSKI